ADPADACPTVAGSGSNGCPPIPPPTSPDTTAPVVTFANVASKMKRGTFLKGITVKFSANESAAFDVDLLGKAKGATLARAADVGVAGEDASARPDRPAGRGGRAAGAHARRLSLPVPRGRREHRQRLVDLEPRRLLRNALHQRVEEGPRDPGLHLLPGQLDQ